jgi:N6-adenosine-specific RNA methylase IME4
MPLGAKLERAHMTKNYQNHEAADCFPPMHTEERLAELAEDIRANGLLEPIVLFEGKVLDGRNRLAACGLAGVEPTFVDFDGDEDEAYAYVESRNAMRRDLADDARSLAIVRLFKKREAAKTTKELAQAARVTPSRMARVERVETCPELADLVWSGKAKASAVEKFVDAPEDVRRRFVEKVEAGVKPTHAARELKREELADKSIELPEGQFRVIYADPPWQYGDSKGFEAYDKTAAEGHYPTMPLDDICALDVKSIAAENSVLFMWGTFPLLPDALKVIAAWGFKYKTAFVWDKQRVNMGNYHTADAELLFVATRGSCVPDADKRERQVQRIERTERHSAKPEDFRKLIDTLYPKGPRVELFRRGAAPEGWVVLGNEVE